MGELSIQERLKNEIQNHQILLFMKGNPDNPQCGFSAQVTNILKSHNAEFHTVDVLADYDIREGIKEFSNWPTIPQLYVKGNFIGGCDIVMDMERKGELGEVLVL